MVQWMIDWVNNVSKLHWTCGPNNVIDDTLVAEGAPCPYFKSGGGRKSAKSGIGHDVLMNGQWMWHIHMHRSLIESSFEKGKIVEGRVKLMLATLPPSKWMRVWLDRAYTTWRILQDVNDRNFYFVCTFKSGKRGPLQWLIGNGLCVPKLEKGESDFVISESGIVAFVWHDSAVVCFMTNMVDLRSSEFIDTGEPVKFSMPGSGAPNALSTDKFGHVIWPIKTPHHFGGTFWVLAIAAVCFY